MTITVVGLRSKKTDPAIKRFNISRGTALGNATHLLDKNDDAERAAAIARFAEQLAEDLRPAPYGNLNVKLRLDTLTAEAATADIELGCAGNCRPARPCHGDVIKAEIERRLAEWAAREAEWAARVAD